MSSYQNNLNSGTQLNGLSTASTPSTSPAPSFAGNGGASTVSVLSNGPSSSPASAPVTGSPVAAWASLPPDQIIVPVGNVSFKFKIVPTQVQVISASFLFPVWYFLTCPLCFCRYSPCGNVSFKINCSSCMFFFFSLPLLNLYYPLWVCCCL